MIKIIDVFEVLNCTSKLCGFVLCVFHQVPIQDTLVSHWRSARLAELRLCPQLPGAADDYKMDGLVHVVSEAKSFDYHAWISGE